MGDGDSVGSAGDGWLRRSLVTASTGQIDLIGSLAVAAVALAIGMLRFRDQPYWFDESVSALVVRRSFGGLVQVLYDQEAGMYAYYMGLWGWSQIPGLGGDAGLRAFSVVGAAVTVGLIYRFCASRFSRRAAVIASVLCLSNPFFLRYMTEVRTYSWLMACAVGTAMAVTSFCELSSWRRTVVLGGLVGAGTSMFTLFPLLPICLLIPVVITGKYRPDLRRLVPAAVVALLVWLPALPALIAQNGQLDWIRSPTMFTFRHQTIEMLGGPAFSIILVVGLIAALVSLRPNSGLVEAKGRAVLAGSLLAALAAPATTILISLAKPLYISRYLSWGFPFVIIAAAVGFDRLPNMMRLPRRFAAAPAVLVIAAGIALWLDARPFHDTARVTGEAAAVDYVLSNLTDGDQIFIATYPPAVIHYLGYRPDIDPTAQQVPDNRMYGEPIPVSLYMHKFESAGTVFIIYSYGWAVPPQIRQLVDERRPVHSVRFGSTWVIEATK